VILLAEEVNELWKWPNFLMLAGLLGYLIKKHGGPLLAARSQEIRESLEAGKKAKIEADARAAAVQTKIANLDREVSELRANSKAELGREGDRVRRDAENELSRLEHQTQAEIIAIGKQAQNEVRQYAAKLALDLAEQKIRGRMTADAQSTLLNNFSTDVAGYSGEGGSR
jgi:F-type H+-transporting ATPase subunit b